MISSRSRDLLETYHGHSAKKSKRGLHRNRASFETRPSGAPQDEAAV
jgi:hypothetical protein